MKTLLSGNEAIARGAFEFGCVFAAAYPGTPSTEILENVAKYKEIKSQWSPNEKVAMEVAIGAAMAGARSLCAMKHVGVNVAADPLMSFAFMEVKGGFVLVSADDPGMHSSQNEQDSRFYGKDDPGMHSSQNEQDNRNYGKFAKIPVLDPSDSAEAKEFVGKAFEISETFHAPVMLRTTTRTSHGKGLVQLGDPMERKVSGFEKNFEKLVVLPMNARKLRVEAETRLRKLEDFAEETDLNFEESGEGRYCSCTSERSAAHSPDFENWYALSASHEENSGFRVPLRPGYCCGRTGPFCGGTDPCGRYPRGGEKSDSRDMGIESGNNPKSP